NVPGTWPPDPVPGVMLSGFPLSGATFAGNTGEVVTRAQLDDGKVPTAYRDNLQVIRDNLAALEIGAWTPWFAGKVAQRPVFRGTMRAVRLAQDEYYLTPLYRIDDGLLVSEPRKLRGEISAKLGEPYIP